jgi:biopolymer transport protein ExbD/biopolymer transport protein TolR
MAIQSSGKKDLFTEINITPLTDIFLVLLIIMMVIAPMFQSMDKNIKLPSIKNGISLNEKEVTVAITKDSRFFINTSPVEESQLAEKLAGMLEQSKDKKVVVKADSLTKEKYILSVMKAAQQAGYEKLTVAGEPLSGKQQKSLEELKPSHNAEEGES